MKKTIVSITLFVLSVALASAQMFTLSTTTLSSAVAVSDNQFCLASGTGVVTPSITAPGSILFVDFESVQVTGTGNGTTCYTVARDLASNQVSHVHVSGEIVWVIPVPNQAYSRDKGVGDSCTASAEYVLPAINTQSGNIFDCRSSGQWIQIGHGSNGTPPSQRVSALCSSTAGSAETEYLNFAACSGATTNTTFIVQDSPGTLYSLRVYSSAAVVGGTNKDVLTVLKNGSATTLTCTIAASGTTCSDVTHSAAVVAGDVISFKFVTATSDTAANVSATVEKN